MRYTPTYSQVLGDVDLRPGRPGLIGDPNSGPGIHTITKWFNTSAFTLAKAPAGSFKSLAFGNSARNLVVGPGLQLIDASLQKQIRLRERVSLTLHLESFHAMNHANFAAPALDLFNAATVGVISSTSAAARQTQLGARIEF